MGLIWPDATVACRERSTRPIDSMRLRFSKMHGLGNDFMVVDLVTQHVELDAGMIARWADRGTRRSIIAWALAAWSAMTAISGMATGFWTLAGARIGVGIGEAGGTPPSHSLIRSLIRNG